MDDCGDDVCFENDEVHCEVEKVYEKDGVIKTYIHYAKDARGEYFIDEILHGNTCEDDNECENLATSDYQQ